MRSLIVPLVVMSLVASGAPPVSAHHRANLYCSETGDICQSVRKVDGVRKLSIVMAARYFDHFRLCVDSFYRECKRFRVRSLDSGLYGRSVRWREHFTPFNAREFTVVWRAGGQRIGKKLGFHVRKK